MLLKSLFNVPLIFLASAVVALADERVDGAIKSLEALAANSEQLARYCEIVPPGPDVDAVQAEQISVELDKFWSSLGPEYESLVGLEGELAENSKEVAALEAAFDNLEKKCKRD
jgi:hypothetical protein